MACRDVFSEILTFLDNATARYRILEHAAEGESVKVASERGTTVSQGAKALVCDISGSGTRTKHALAVVSGIDRADLKVLARFFGGKNASFSRPETVLALTGCQSGSVPPFVLDHSLALVVDVGFLERHSEIAFNAGRLDRSIVLNAADYVRIFQPVRLNLAKPSG
jgi:Ala-tRNA(Pro) deacylase